MVSTAAGILVTRSAEKQSLGHTLTTQLFLQPKVLGVLSFSMLLLSAFSLVTGVLPWFPFLAMGALLYLCGFQFIWADHLEPTFGYGPFLVLLLVIGGLMFAPMLTLSRLIRRALGIPDPEPFDQGEWRAADQLHYAAGERVDRFQGQWRIGPGTDWPGNDAGRGQRHESDWRGNGA